MAAAMAANLNVVGVPSVTTYMASNNLIVNYNLLDEPKFCETFSTYKIFTLELISTFCFLQV